MVVIIKKSISAYLITTLILGAALAGYFFMPETSEATYVDSTIAEGSSATPACTVPTGVQAGDIVIMVVSNDHINAAYDTADWPSGFTELSEVDMTNDGHSAAIGWKRLTGADSGSYTFGNNGASSAWLCQAYAFRGRDTNSPPTLTTNTNNSANTNPVTITATGLTALEGDDLLFVSVPDIKPAGVGNRHSSWTSPFSEVEDGEDSTGWVNMAGATSENVSAGSTGNKTVSFAITSGDSGWTAWLVRIPKEPDASPPVSSTPHVKIRGGVGITTITPGTGTEFSDPDGSGTDNFSVEVAAGSNKVLFVAVAYQGTSISITYDGVSMTQLWEDTDGANAQHSTGWILVNPSTGVNTLAITWTGAILAGFAQPWYGVAQGGTEGTTWRAPTTAYDGGSGSGTASVTASNAVAGDMVLDVLAVYGENPTADASQTVQNEQNGPYSTTLNYGTSNKLATGATTMQWTMPSNFWTIGAVPLIPASSGSIISPVKIRGGGGGGVKFR